MRLVDKLPTGGGTVTLDGPLNATLSAGTQAKPAVDTWPVTTSATGGGKAGSGNAATEKYFTPARIIGLVAILAILGGAFWWYNKN